MPQQVKSVKTPFFHSGGRGHDLNRWLHYSDLTPQDKRATATQPDYIVGAEYDYFNYWVVFKGLQVIQIVPQEVHSYWHLNFQAEVETGGVCEVEDSEWIKSFKPRHLANAKHYILEFYDDLVEVICTDLAFGKGRFNLEKAAETDPYFTAHPGITPETTRLSWIKFLRNYLEGKQDSNEPNVVKVREMLKRLEEQLNSNSDK